MTQHTPTGSQPAAEKRRSEGTCTQDLPGTLCSPLRHHPDCHYANAADLLEAMEKLTNIVACLAVNEAQVAMFNWDNVVRDARAAIRQAKGEQPS